MVHFPLPVHVLGVFKYHVSVPEGINQCSMNMPLNRLKSHDIPVQSLQETSMGGSTLWKGTLPMKQSSRWDSSKEPCFSSGDSTCRYENQTGTNHYYYYYYYYYILLLLIITININTNININIDIDIN